MSNLSIGQSFSAYQAMNLRNPMGGGPPADAGASIENDDISLDDVLDLKDTRLTEDLFTDADTDGSGELSYEELEAMLEQFAPSRHMGAMGMAGGPGGPLPGGSPPDIDEIFDTEDLDGDGMISAQESALSSDMFDTIDADSDGYITEAEIQESLPESSDLTVGTGDSEPVRALNSDIAMAAYQSAVQSLFSPASEADTSRGTGYLTGIFA